MQRFIPAMFFSLLIASVLTGCARQSAPRDNRETLYERGINYLYGRDGAPQHIAFANYWLKQAAVQNYAPAMYHWGVNNELGVGMRQNLPAAVKWYSHAAMQGHKLAQHNLATLYYHGLGVPANREIAIFWFSRAALQGHEPARKNLDYIAADMRTVLAAPAPAADNTLQELYAPSGVKPQ